MTKLYALITAAAFAGAPATQIFGPHRSPASLANAEASEPDGLGAAMLYLIEDDAGAFHWSNLAYSHKQFDR